MICNKSFQPNSVDFGHRILHDISKVTKNKKKKNKTLVLISRKCVLHFEKYLESVFRLKAFC